MAPFIFTAETALCSPFNIAILSLIVITAELSLCNFQYFAAKC